ncbi:reverse transcriptase [Tanacetum coccineum]
MAKGLARGSLTYVHCRVRGKDMHFFLAIGLSLRLQFTSSETSSAQRDNINHLTSIGCIRASMNMIDLTDHIIEISIEKMVTTAKKRGQPLELIFTRANVDSKAHTVVPNAASQVLWSPPFDGAITINGDGGISSRNGVEGIGFVTRCHDGSVLVAGHRYVGNVTSVIEVEAKAILWAI